MLSKRSPRPATVQDTPDDFVVATGETHSVQEFCDLAFGHAGMELKWEGTGTEMVWSSRLDPKVGNDNRSGMR